MSAVPNLKKKLKGIRATEKLSKAMKTVSAAKYAKLSMRFKCYYGYAGQYRSLFGGGESAGAGDETALCGTVVVFGSDRGFCGGFNNAILQFFKEEVPEPAHLIVLGTEIGRLFAENGISAEAVLPYESVPDFFGTGELYGRLNALSGGEPDYRVALVYPSYINTMTQTPVTTVLTLNPVKTRFGASDLLLFPDGETIRAGLAGQYVRVVLYGTLLETALGAQAATMMTMRSAYDTATELGGELVSEIQRKRQQDVTADVLETTADIRNREKGDDADGGT